MISIREIMKNKSTSKENSAAESGKNLFTQPQDLTDRLINKIVLQYQPD
jgi:hypothetical protein